MKGKEVSGSWGKLWAWLMHAIQWKHSVQDINGEVLCGKQTPLIPSPSKSDLISYCGGHLPNATPASVSQFTLLASTKKGSKPDFHGALGGDEAKRLYDYFFSKVREGYLGERVKDGVFQAMMEVALVNDGPVSSTSFQRVRTRSRNLGDAPVWERLGYEDEANGWCRLR